MRLERINLWNVWADRSCLVSLAHIGTLRHVELGGSFNIGPHKTEQHNFEFSFEFFCARNAELSSISFQRTYLSNKMLASLAKHCGESLRSIEIEKCRGITAAGMKKFFAECENLASVSVFRCFSGFGGGSMPGLEKALFDKHPDCRVGFLD